MGHLGRPVQRETQPEAVRAEQPQHVRCVHHHDVGAGPDAVRGADGQRRVEPPVVGGTVRRRQDPGHRVDRGDVQRASRGPRYVPVGVAQPVEQVHHRAQVAEDVLQRQPAAEVAQELVVDPRERCRRREQPGEQGVRVG